MHKKLTINFWFLEWLTWKNKDPLFEHYEDIILAESLREFCDHKERRTLQQEVNDKSTGRTELILTSTPNNHIINLMQNEIFQNANQVFKGQLRRNKNQGKDKSTPRSDISPDDLEKLYDNYFTPRDMNVNTEVLMHKVFFDIMYFTGRRAKEGLRNLNKKSFDLKTSSDGVEYIEINFNETTKRNQGDSTSSATEKLHNNHAKIKEQEGDIHCPVNSFKHYTENLNDKCDAFFQYPDKNKTGFDNKPIGKNALGALMKEISKEAKLSKIYTNHCIRKTTATGMHRQGYTLKEIANVTKHKNLQSLEHYIGGPNHTDKECYSASLFEYSKNKIHQKNFNLKTPTQPPRRNRKHQMII